MSQVTPRGPVKPELNITPLIDVVFLLIVFFMLVSNIASDQIVEMVLPDIEDSSALMFEDENRIIVNIAPQPDDTRRLGMAGDPLRHDGRAAYVQVGNIRIETGDLQGITEALRNDMGDSSDPRPVLLRADGALHYSQVSPVIDAITRAGIGDVKLVAYLPEELR